MIDYICLYRGDVIASVKHARTITRHLHPVARMVELPGGHLITHQHTEEVKQTVNPKWKYFSREVDIKMKYGLF